MSASDPGRYGSAGRSIVPLNDASEKGKSPPSRQRKPAIARVHEARATAAAKSLRRSPANCRYRARSRQLPEVTIFELERKIHKCGRRSSGPNPSRAQPVASLHRPMRKSDEMNGIKNRWIEGNRRVRM